MSLLVIYLVQNSDEAAKYQAVPGVKYPIVPGHEIVGEVVAIPSTEARWKVGQVVGSGWHGGHCHTCGSCRTGDYMMCEKEDVNGECDSCHKNVRTFTLI